MHQPHYVSNHNPTSLFYKSPRRPNPPQITPPQYQSIHSPMATSSLLSLTLCFLLQLHLLLSFHQCLAARLSEGQRARWDECRIESLNKLEPAQRIQHEAGVSEVWDENNKQMQCAGVAVTRHVVEAKGLILPSFNNAPMLIYITQGSIFFIPCIYCNIVRVFRKLDYCQAWVWAQAQHGLVLKRSEPSSSSPLSYIGRDYSGCACLVLPTAWSQQNRDSNKGDEKKKCLKSTNE